MIVASVGALLALLFVGSLLGHKVVLFLVRGLAALLLAGITWFIHGMSAGHGSIEIFLCAVVGWFAIFYIISPKGE